MHITHQGRGIKTRQVQSDKYACSIIKCKFYLLDNKIFSLDLSFQNSNFLSITNWGDDLILKEEPFASLEYLKSDGDMIGVMISVLEVS